VLDRRVRRVRHADGGLALARPRPPTPSSTCARVSTTWRRPRSAMTTWTTTCAIPRPLARACPSQRRLLRRPPTAGLAGRTSASRPLALAEGLGVIESPRFMGLGLANQQDIVRPRQWEDLSQGIETRNPRHCLGFARQCLANVQGRSEERRNEKISESLARKSCPGEPRAGRASPMPAWPPDGCSCCHSDEHATNREQSSHSSLYLS
jgi:hypothetical protein